MSPCPQAPPAQDVPQGPLPQALREGAAEEVASQWARPPLWPEQGDVLAAERPAGRGLTVGTHGARALPQPLTWPHARVIRGFKKQQCPVGCPPRHPPNGQGFQTFPHLPWHSACITDSQGRVGIVALVRGELGPRPSDPLQSPHTDTGCLPAPGHRERKTKAGGHFPAARTAGLGRTAGRRAAPDAKGQTVARWMAVGREVTF